MKKIVALPLIVVLALGLSACGEDDGAGKYVGTYQVTNHTLNDGACDVEGPEVTDGPTYFKIENADFFGFPILNIYNCTSATECDEDPFNFFSKQQDGWKIEVRSSYEYQGECNLTETIGPLETTEAGVKLEIKSSKGVVTPAGGEECDPDLVHEYPEAMVCEEYEVLEGSKI